MSGQVALPLVTEAGSDRVAGWVAVAPVGILNHEPALPKITAPVLAVWGEHQQGSPAGTGRSPGAKCQTRSQGQ